MGLYDDRLSDLSEPRRNRRVAQRRPLPSPVAPRRGNPMLRQRGPSVIGRGQQRSAPMYRPPSPSPDLRRRLGVVEASRRPSMDVQSLLFGRDADWTASKAKAWAKSHGYKYGKVDVTDQYIRIRQFDPKGFKVKRTVPFGHGIRAVVAREDSMRTTTAREAPRRRRRTKKRAAPAAKRPRRRRARKVKTTAVAARRKRRKVRVEARRSRRRRAPAGRMMEAKRARRRPRRRTARATEAWRGDSAGHAKAARKGHRRRRKAGTHKRRRRVRETMVAETPRRRRRSSRRRTHETSYTMEAKRPRHRRSRRTREASRGGAMGPGEFALAFVSAGLGFVIADGLDRMLATYDPSATGEKPKDLFTSDGAGTLANTLNVAAMPNWKRVVTGIGVTAAPAVGSMFVDNPYVRSSLEGAAIGSGVSLFKTLWNNVLMPLLIGKDTTTPALQKSYIARLYPAEVAAHINMRKTDDKGAPLTPQMAVSSAGSGALSGAPDVGPFAVGGDSPYPDAAQALRREAGVQDFPTVQNTWGTGGPGNDHPTAAQAMGTGAPWQPGPPPGPGPGPQAQPHTEPECVCLGDGEQFSSFLGDAPADESSTLFNVGGPA